MNHLKFDLQRLIAILEGAEELRRMRLYRKLRELIPVPGPDTKVSEELAPLAKILYEPPTILYEPPFPLRLHIDPPEFPVAHLVEMVAAARQICHNNLEYLDSLDKQLK